MKDLDISVGRLRSIVNRYGDSLFKTATLAYTPPEQAGGSARSVTRPWKHSYDPSHYYPATLSVVPTAKTKKLKAKLLR